MDKGLTGFLRLVYARMCVYMYVQVHTPTFICVLAHVCMYVCSHVYVCTCV